jgi:hypothetical protein
MLVAASGCAGLGRSEPLPSAGKPGRIAVCADYRGDGVLTSGNDVTGNQSDQRLTIDSVEFSDSSGMDVLGVKLVRQGADGGPASVGLDRVWPRSMAEATSDELRVVARAPDAVGATIPPADGSEMIFTVGVRAKPGATASGLRVAYHDEDGNRYVWVGAASLRVGDPYC